MKMTDCVYLTVVTLYWPFLWEPENNRNFSVNGH